jgi:acetolactate decarboxylase
MAFSNTYFSHRNPMKTHLFAAIATACIALFCSCNSQKQESRTWPAVGISGAMKNVMWKGELSGTIDCDTISGKTHLYGVGPVEYLTGEILIIGGVAYKSSVLTDSTMRIEQTFRLKAPFFVYTHVARWQEHPLPDSIRTIPQLETYLDMTTKKARRPFAFLLSGQVDSAAIHIVNLPKGTIVHSPDDAHRGETVYHLVHRTADIVGFFSTEHQGIFTHHDTYLHMHLITGDKTAMGHLDRVSFSAGKIKLYLPAE